MIDKKKQGRKNKRDGAKFELDVRKMFEDEGWIVTKFRNNIDLQTDEIVMARNYYIPGRGNVMGSGFPDFVMFRKMTKGTDDAPGYYEVQFVECKRNIKRLSKEEKLKLKVLRELGHTTYIAYLDEKEIMLRLFEGYDKT